MDMEDSPYKGTPDESDNNIKVQDLVGEMTVERAIELLSKKETDFTGKEYLRRVTAVRDPKNPALCNFLSMKQSSAVTNYMLKVSGWNFFRYKPPIYCSCTNLEGNS
jgi:hypothetical protein